MRRKTQRNVPHDLRTERALDEMFHHLPHFSKCEKHNKTFRQCMRHVSQKGGLTGAFLVKTNPKKYFKITKTKNLLKPKPISHICLLK
jgi:hypothetical protein